MTNELPSKQSKNLKLLAPRGTRQIRPFNTAALRRIKARGRKLLAAEQRTRKWAIR